MERPVFRLQTKEAAEKTEKIFSKTEKVQYAGAPLELRHVELSKIELFQKSFQNNCVEKDWRDLSLFVEVLLLSELCDCEVGAAELEKRRAQS